MSFIAMYGVLIIMIYMQVENASGNGKEKHNYLKRKAQAAVERIEGRDINEDQDKYSFLLTAMKFAAAFTTRKKLLKEARKCKDPNEKEKLHRHIDRLARIQKSTNKEMVDMAKCIYSTVSDDE